MAENAEAGYEEAQAGAGARWEFFNGQMAQVRVPRGYQFGLLLVALAMILLPVIYFGIFAGLAWGLYWYAIHAFGLVFHTTQLAIRLQLFAFCLYIAPLIAGVVIALFMLRPIFARWPRLDRGQPISHLDHPLLFRFIGQLCQQMGAPIPSRIDVNVDIGASAGFREGFRSMFGNDIKLTLGLPLAASMTCREFGALVAHELGHFTQRSAMRMDCIVRSVNRWLIRAVYEPDTLDDWLDEAGEDNAFTLFLYLVVRLATGFTRGILWLLLMLGHAISSYMSRQMEFHADACAIAVGGSDGFVAMLRRLLVLLQCSERAAVEASNRLRPKCPDDLSAYLAMLSAQCAGETQGQILRKAAKDKTRWCCQAIRPSLNGLRRPNEPPPWALSAMIARLPSCSIIFPSFPKNSRRIITC